MGVPNVPIIVWRCVEEVERRGLDIIGESIPDRTTEKVYKIWIAPYVDDKDNFHREQSIFFTSEPTRWAGFE